ncbi:MAG TPA: ABC transporter permease subunit [Thermoanaerobaculaceae bacterium]|nr:ABC transporter permease subunit [Thermoanaerobaculaceae bacterium]
MSPLAASRLRRSRAVDRLVAALITVGGSSVLLAVAFLMVFLVAQCLPLVRGGTLVSAGAVREGPNPVVALEDEYRSAVTLVGEDGSVHVVPRTGAPRALALDGVQPPVRQGRVDAAGRLVALEDASGTITVWEFRAAVVWHGNVRETEPSLRRVGIRAGYAGAPILDVAGDAANPAVLVATASGAVVLSGADESATSTELALATTPRVGALSSDGSQAWLATARQLAWFQVAGRADAVATAEATVPLAAAPTAAAVVVGDVTLLLGDESGAVGAWQVVTGAVAGSKVLDLAGTFRGGGAVRALAVSQRDKAFLVQRTGNASLAYLTGRQMLVRVPHFPPDAVAVGISPRRDGAFAVTPAGDVHRWALDLAYPEATVATLFLPTRYEGFTEAELAWQSTGGSESFEPKLSLVPLIVGTLKGALYALLFSAPCALAAALFVSQFAPAALRQLTKPVVELMAALPSVVVGFLAALFFAPLLQRHIVGTLGLLALLPVAVVLAAALWRGAPVMWRRRLTAGRELALVTGLLAAVTVTLFAAERGIERVLFAGDFKGWLLAAAGVTYDQRNAVVVGFALGFAVIPIIFTLAEDALSNVPPSLISASLALGASRWQAARTVAIPAASPGLFAAVMTGLGRAVGETMIVLMATGNTPILSLSPFDGMRTMSACIAVELPEAPYGGTLYRVLILTALILFAMTFVINTVAVMISNRLRRRFGRLAA